MGLLDLFKPKPKPELKPEDVAYYEDGKPVSLEEAKRRREKWQAEAAADPNPIYHRTDEEQMMKVNFHHQNAQEVDTRDARLSESYIAARAERDLDRKIVLLEKALSIFQEEKAWFDRTPAGALYFQDRWEHLHNSRNSDFSFYEQAESDLAYCVRVRDVVIPGILQAASADGGAKQASLCKLLDVPAQDFRDIVARLEADGKIERVKKGGAYWVFTK